MKQRTVVKIDHYRFSYEDHIRRSFDKLFHVIIHAIRGYCTSRRTPDVVSNKMKPAHSSSSNIDKEDEVSKVSSENGSANSDQFEDKQFVFPREHIKRNKRKGNQMITGKDASVGNVMGAPELVRHLFVKRISKVTKDEDVFTVTEPNGFTIKELKCVSHPEAHFKSLKLAVRCSEFKLFNENLWPKGFFDRTYWSQKPGSK